jgi:CDP-diacylglycerol--glycerol-3-phosphate 3-phosphatidyltransferase
MKSSSRQFLFVQSLTLGRIPLILLFLVVTLATNTRESSFWFVVALGSMVLSALTDLFDGYFARRFNVTSRLGAYADPLTDKIFYIVSFPTLVFLAGMRGEAWHTLLLLILTILFLIRDQWVSFLRSIGALYQMSGRANWAGKTRTLITFPVICMIYWYLQVPAGWWLKLPIWLVMAAEVLCLIINFVSIWIYTRNYWPAIRSELRPTDENGPSEK